MNKITITKPNDCHLHLRDGDALKSVVNFSAKQMAKAVIMPNLNPPIVTTAQALKYKQRIINAKNDLLNFEPLMTLYLTPDSKPSEVKLAKEAGIVGFKLYPTGATTNSNFGISNIKSIYPMLEQMQKYQMPLLIHGEVVDKEIDVFDREAVFIDKILINLVANFPVLKIAFEHITTKEAVEFVLSAKDNIVATITPQHLLNNRNDMLVGGIRPHYFCLPILKRNIHQQVLIKAATSGNAKFFLGTDSAPHSQDDKESACGCAGCFSAPFAIEFYAKAFDKIGKIGKLDNFASKFGANFYNLAQNNEKIILIKENFKINSKYNFAGKNIIPYGFKDNLPWKILY